MLLGGTGYIDGLVQDSSISSVLAMEMLQSCTKPSILFYLFIFLLHNSFQLLDLELLDWGSTLNTCTSISTQIAKVKIHLHSGLVLESCLGVGNYSL